MPCSKNSGGCGGLTNCRACSGKTLAEIVRCYRKTCSPNLWKDLRELSVGKTDAEILESSCGSIFTSGKMHSHQRRVGSKVLRDARAALKDFPIGKFDSFESLHCEIQKKIMNIPRVGALTVYDIALRVGYSKKMYPQKVYLHTGALTGARNLIGTRARQGVLGKDDFPEALRSLDAMEIENLLCICKAALKEVVRHG